MAKNRRFSANFVKEIDGFSYGGFGRERKFMSNLLSSSRNLYQRDLLAHYGCVNAIEFSPNGDLLASGGDDRRLLLWTVDSILTALPKPVIMKGEHSSNIFSIAFDNKQNSVLSAGNDERVLLHDVETGETKDVFLHTDAVYGLSVDPLNDNVFASAGDDGKILIWDIREPPSADPFCLTHYKSAFYGVMYNPVEPRLIATANNKEGVALWDIRKPRKCCILSYGGSHSSQSAMSIRFNTTGTKLLALRRRLSPVLYNLYSSEILHEFDAPGYYNSCTMKSCCFAGYNDEYVLSGSDDFKLYMWKIPSESSKEKYVRNTHMVLKGHRSIVNQVRFNSCNFMLASSGVEKIVKLWSVFPMPGCKGSLINGLTKDGTTRKFYSPEDYINLVLNSGMFMTHDYSLHSVHEDSRMMAFFDSLVQRDIEGWTSDSTDSYAPEDLNWEVTLLTSSSTSSSSSNDNKSSTSSSSSNSSSESTDDATGVGKPHHSSSYPANKKESTDEKEMEISDILSKRIACKRREMKRQLSKSNKSKKKKFKKRLMSIKKKRLLRSSSSSNSEDEARQTESCSSTAQVSQASDRGFFTIDSILGPPVWLRYSEESSDPRDRRKELQKRRARLLQNLSDSDASITELNDNNDSKDDQSDKNECNNCPVILDPEKLSATNCTCNNKQVNDKSKNETNDISVSNADTNGTLMTGIASDARSTDDEAVNVGASSSTGVVSESLKCETSIETNGVEATSPCRYSDDNSVVDEPVDLISQNGTDEQYISMIAGPSNSNSSNNNVTWAEFKRFKSRMHRASRHYRNQHRNDDDSD